MLLNFKENNLDALFDEFYSIKNAEGIAESTLQQYKDNYSYFVLYLDKKKIERNINALNRKVMRNYIIYMREEIVRFDGHKFKKEDSKSVGLSISTINTRLKTLRVMFNCLLDEEIIDANPMEGIKNLREQVEDFIVLSVAELRKLLKAPNRKMFAGFRDYVIMNVLLDGMMRIGELTKLKEGDFEFASKTVTIRASVAKSRKPRIIPLKPSTLRLVKQLIKVNEEFGSEYVFLTNYGEPIEGDHFRKRLNDYAEIAEIKKGVHPHLFRHTAATLFLEAGGDMRHLQMLLGHADLRMVIRYTHLSNKALQAQHEKYSPINQVGSKLSRPRKSKI